MSLRVSVVVPTYRRPELLGRCLAALTAQKMASDSYEIIVADDAASSETRRQVEELAAKTTCSVLYLPMTGTHGPAAARNAGWRAARAAIIAFTDDDAVADAGWLTAGTGALERDCELAAVAGHVIVPLPPSPTDYQRNEAGLATAAFVTANCFCRRDVLQTLGGFDERFTHAWREDSDLHLRLLEGGFKLRKVPEAVVVHPVRQASWGISLGACLGNARHFRVDPVSVGVLAAVWGREVPCVVLLVLLVLTPCVRTRRSERLLIGWLSWRRARICCAARSLFLNRFTPLFAAAIAEVHRYFGSLAGSDFHVLGVADRMTVAIYFRCDSVNVGLTRLKRW
jgi:GT2 family glycosyltransferase